MQTITFSEKAFGTSDPVYHCKINTIRFSGQIVSDSDNPTSPVVSYDQQFIGPVSWTFSAPVSHVEFDAGVFNQVGSTTVKIYDADGTLIRSMKNSATGLQHFSFTHNAGIGKVLVENTSNDDSGFAVDNVSFVNLPPTVDLSGKRDIDALLWGYKWDHTALTYSFPTSADEYLHNGYQQVNGFAALSATQMGAYQKIIANYGNVCGLTFAQTTKENADLRFAQALSIDYSDGQGVHAPGNAPGTAEGIAPDPDAATVSWGDVWFSTNAGGNDNSNPQPGNFIYAAAFMHELGHALGLKHGHGAQNAHGVTFPSLPPDHDSQEYSIMTYNTYPGGHPGSLGNLDYPTTLMQDDIAALQYMYGADYATQKGRTIYSWSPTTGEEFINGVGQGAPVKDKIFMTVWDGGGPDTYDFSNYTTNLEVNLNPGAWTTTDEAQLANLGNHHKATGNIANALLYKDNPQSLIENAFGGTGNDRIVGNAVDNYLKGGQGNDKLFGNDGADLLMGGMGRDFLEGGSGGDTFIYDSVQQSASSGFDTIQGFNARMDRLNLWFSVAKVDKTVVGGALDSANFDGDLSNAITHHQLGADHAVLFDPDSGSYAGATFLIVNPTANPGYHAGLELVIRLEDPHALAQFGVGNFI